MKSNFIYSLLAVLCLFFLVPDANAQFFRSYKSGSDLNTSKGDVLINDEESDWDVAFGFGQSTEFEVEVVDAYVGTEPTYCASGTHDYNASASSDPYYPRQVIYSNTYDYNSDAVRYVVVGETEDGDITTTSCGTMNAFISAVRFSGTCGNPPLVKSVIFGASGYTLEMRDAWSDDANDEVFFTGVATACSGGAKRLMIGKLDIAANPPVLTARILTVIENSTEIEFQSKAIVVDEDNIYIGGTYKGWPADAFIMSIERDALLASGAPANPTTALRTLFDDGTANGQSAIQDMEIHDGYIYAVGQNNPTFSGTSNANGFVIGLETNLDVVSGYEYTKEGSNTAESFRGIAHAGDGEFLLSGHTDGYTADRDIFATRIVAVEGRIYPQFLFNNFLGKNCYIYEHSGNDMNLNIVTCDNGSHVTMFNQFTDGSSIDNQLVIHTSDDLSMPADKDDCYPEIIMDIIYICDDIADTKTVTTTHSNMSEDATISFTRDNDDIGTEVCSTTQGCAPFQGDNSTNTDGRFNSKEIHDVSIYPNPGSGLYHIKSDDKIHLIKVYNMSGRLIEETQVMTNQSQIDLSNFESGQYLVKIYTAEGSFEKTLIKE